MIPAETGERPRGGATEPNGPAAGAKYWRLTEGGQRGFGPTTETDVGDDRLTAAAEPGLSPTVGLFDLANDVAAL
jgi:hypothetical protein